MKISLNWLNEYCKTDLSAEAVAELLTNCGLEVEAVETYESVPGGLRGLVVGEVKEKSKHPNADKLSLTKVDVGGTNLLSIVCGASNVAAGQKVVVALSGAKIHPVDGESFEIKTSKIRGEISEGMICAEDEIGLGKSHDGIMVLDAHAKTGMPAAEYFQVESDYVLEIGLTPNRADAASHFGVARDLAAVLLSAALENDPSAEHSAAQLPTVAAFEEELPESPVKVEVLSPEACVRYSGICIGNLDVKPSPEWMQRRLLSIGVRPINNVVDVTNYVLHELGQPLHAFDMNAVGGEKIVVRKATEGVAFVTLDGTERKLSADDLVICDATKPMCIAGVFGGLHSGVNEKTKNIFLESACFDPIHVRKTSKRLGLKTDSSFRFERGTDPEITVFALQRAVQLLQEISDAEILAAPVDIYPEKVEPAEIAFTFTYCDSLSGKSIPHETIKKIIAALGIEIISQGKDALLLSVPAFKVDVKHEADVVEEVLRIYGYNNIEIPQRVFSSVSHAPHPDAEKINTTVSDFLATSGFSEILNNSLTKEAYSELLPSRDAAKNVKLLNPLSSDLGVLRQTLLFGGLETIAYNINRKNPDLRLFEFGKTYAHTENPAGKSLPFSEQHHLAVFMTGRRSAENWQNKNESVDFFDLKKSVLNILQRLGIHEVKMTAATIDGMEDAMTVAVRKKNIVQFGTVSRKILERFDIAAEVFYADFDWDVVFAVLSSQKEIRFTELPKFPAVRRDLALVLDEKVAYGEIETLAWQTEKNLLREMNLFDVYAGEKIGAGKKSYAVSFILQDYETTLTDNRIDAVMEKLSKVFTEKLGAVIRM